MSIMSVLARAEARATFDDPQIDPEFGAKLAACEARIQRGQKIESHRPTQFRSSADATASTPRYGVRMAIVLW